MPNGLLTPTELDAIQRTYAHIPAIARLLLHARVQHYQLEAVTAERDELRFYRQMEEAKDSPVVVGRASGSEITPWTD